MSLRNKEVSRAETERVRVYRYQDRGWGGVGGLSVLLSLRDVGNHGWLWIGTEANPSGNKCEAKIRDRSMGGQCIS